MSDALGANGARWLAGGFPCATSGEPQEHTRGSEGANLDTFGSSRHGSLIDSGALWPSAFLDSLRASASCGLRFCIIWSKTFAAGFLAQNQMSSSHRACSPNGAMEMARQAVIPLSMKGGN